tara:strand:+ start:296 stop:754 length:459 start_codon:yes stop_codon:yes gene_type:complete
LEELEALVFQRASELGGMMGEETALAPAEGGMEPAAMGAVSEDLIFTATSALVEAGLLDSAVREITPEVLVALEAFVSEIRPGLYDLSNEADLLEVLNGIANGTIYSGAGAAEPAGAGIPAGAEPIPAGAGAGGIPAPAGAGAPPAGAAPLY